MSGVVTAYTRQSPGGTWDLWILTDGRPYAGLAATAAGRLPTLMDRTEALARLGYRPADPSAPASGWAWEEGDPVPGGVELVGQVAVVVLGASA